MPTARTRDVPTLGRQRLLAAVVGLALALATGAVVSHHLWGLSLTMDGVVLAVPLGTPPEVSAGGSHAFVHTQRDGVSPVAFDPCREVEFVVNDTAAPPGTEGVVEEAVAAVSAATGLVFVHRGATDAVPVPSPALLAPRREPVLIAWTTPQHVPELAGSVAGIGGSSVEQQYLSGRRQYLTGMVALDARQLAGLLREPSGTAVVRAVVMHELAHVVGLDHVDDPGELMHPRDATVLDFGPGDREGLAALGAGRCFP